MGMTIRNNDEKILSTVKTYENSKSFSEKSVIHASVYYEHYRCDKNVQRKHRKFAEQIFEEARKCRHCRFRNHH